MKRAIAIALTAAATLSAFAQSSGEAGATRQFVFSKDGTNVIGRVRYLPPQWRKVRSGEIVRDLRSQPLDVILSCGFYPAVADLRKIREDGLTIDGWSIGNNAAYPITSRHVEPVVTRYSKYRLCIEIASIGKWDQFDAWLKSNKIGGLPLEAAFNGCTYMQSDDVIFNAVRNMASEALGISKAEIDEILGRCVDTGM